MPLRTTLLSLAFLGLAGTALAAGPPAGRRDLHGDPLPAGAVVRLGTVRWRHAQGLRYPVLSPDGRWLLSSGGEWDAYLWEAATGRLFRRVVSPEDAPANPFSSYAFLPDGKHVMSSDGDSHSYLWEIPSFRLVKRWEGKDPPGLAFSPSGDQVAGWAEGGVRVFSLRTGKGRTIRVAPLDCWSMAFTRDGCLVVLEKFTTVVGKPGETRFGVVRLDLRTGRVVHRFRIEADGARLAPDGRRVAAVDPKGRLTIWDVESGTRSHVEGIPDDDGFIQIAFTPDGRRLIALGRVSRVLCAYDLDRRPLLVHRLTLADSSITGSSLLDGEDMLVSPGGTILYIPDLLGKAVTRACVRTGRPVPDLAGFASSPFHLDWSAGGRFVSALEVTEVTRWDALTGRRLGRVPFSEGSYPSYLPFPAPGIVLAAAPRGKAIAYIDAAERKLTLVDRGSGRVTHRLPGHSSEVVAMSFRGDGRQLASADKAGQLRCWDVDSGRCLHVLDASKRAKNLKGVLFTPDGTQVVVIEQGGRVHLWDARTWKHLRCSTPAPENPPEEPGEEKPVAAISPTGELLVVSYRGVLRAWDLSSLRECPFENEPDPYTYHWTGPGFSFSADGRFLARLGNELSLYEVASGQVVHRFKGLCHAAAFHPSTLRLATAHEKRVDVLIWDLKPLFLTRPVAAATTLPSAWDRLRHPRAAEAQQAAWVVATLPGMERFLARELRPVARLDPAWLGRQIGELASDRFLSRENAEAALATAGEAAEPALRRALHTAKDLEQRRRIERLLGPLAPRSPERLQKHRAVLALEVRGTEEARRVLRRLADGAPGARLTEEARAALARLLGGR